MYNNIMKRRLKKRYVILIIFIIFIGCFFVLNNNIKSSKDTKEIKIDKIEVVYKKINNEEVSLDFIKWVNSNYKNSINKLYELLKIGEYDKDMWHQVTGYSYLVLNDLYNDKYKNMDNIKVMDEGNTISFVGDVSLADNWWIMPEYDKRGKKILGILSEDVVKIMNDSSVMIVNSEFTVSNRGTPIKGKQYTFRAKPERLKIYYEMGVDMVTLANNHVYDYGSVAFNDMLKAFKEYKIPYIGAGKNLSEASREYYFIVNGYKIAFVNGSRAEKYRLTPGATENSGGIFLCYDTTNMVNKIKEVRKESDYVITIVHYGKENSHELEKEQIKSSYEYIDAGSDVIVGHHAHTLQGVEYYKNKPIIYNLGNFIFNPLEIDTAIFQIELEDNGNMKYKMIPALQKNEYTDILTGKDKQRVIDDLNSWSRNAKIDKDGYIIKEV